MAPITRREAIAKVLTAAGVTTVGGAILASCGSDDTGTGTATTASDATTSGSTAGSAANSAASSAATIASGTEAGGENPAATGECEAADDTTAGPYPDTLGMVDDSAFERSDITEGMLTDAVPVTLTINVVDIANDCGAVPGAKVEIWHCTPSGTYSEYADQPGGYDGTGETFLRGWQTTDDSGAVTFSTIYPGWYIPRTTHIHIQVYRDGDVVKTTQLGFDDVLNSEVNNSDGYGGENKFTNANDQVFVEEGDGADDNLINASGSVADGFVGTYTVGV